MPNSLESFAKEIKKMLSESIINTFRPDGAGSIRAGQMLTVGNAWGTIVRTPGKNTPVVKIFLHTGKYVNIIKDDFVQKLDGGEIKYIK